MYKSIKYFFLFFLFTFTAPSIAGEIARTLFVENNLARTLSSLNLETGVIRNNVLTLGQVPNQILAYRDRLFVLHSVPAELMVIDAASLQILSRIPLPEGSNPYNMALVGANRIYVTLLLANAVAVVNVKEARVDKLIPCGDAPQGILVDGNTALVANTGGYPSYLGSSVAFIDVSKDSLVDQLSVPANAQVVRKGPDWNYYVLCSGLYGKMGGQLVVINPYAPPDYSKPGVVDTFALGGFPGDLAVLPNGIALISDWGDQSGGFLYKVNLYSGQILHDATNPLRVGRGAMRLFWDKKTAELYLSAFDQDVIQKYDVTADRVIATYPMGDGSQDMAIVEKFEASDPWADEVVAFIPGQPWSKTGYDYFPDNVLGPPDQDRSLNSTNASSNLEELLSLGHGGQITLAFTDNLIIDGPGADFLVFENVFNSLWTGQPFVEAATVAVSQDGVRFFEFPFDTLSLKGLAGSHVIKSTAHPTNPDSSGADAFDLAELGLEWIRYVKLVDMGDRWQEGPFNGDFDLDAVVAVHSEAIHSEPVAHFKLWPNYPNPFNGRTTLRFDLAESGSVHAEIYNLLGQKVVTLMRQYVSAGAHSVVWDGRNSAGQAVASGVYWGVVQVGGAVQRQKMALIK